MKLKSEFILTGNPGEQQIAVPLENGEGFHGIVRLNDSGAEVFKALSEGLTEQQAAQRLMDKYEGLDQGTAEKAVAVVIQKLKDAGLTEE